MSFVRRVEDQVILKDVAGMERRIKLYKAAEIEALERAALRSHAVYLYQMLGSRVANDRVPDTREELIAWVLRVQRSHLGVGGESPARGSPSPMRGSNLAGIANAEMAADGTLLAHHQTRKYILEESHSKHAQMLAERDPAMAAAILKEINDGIQRFHDGIYGGDLWLSQRKLAEDIYKELNRDKIDSFLRYKDKFLNFSVVVGNIGYSGNIPCFRYKVMYPEKWTHIYETAYISVFFTLKEDELRMLCGDEGRIHHEGGSLSRFANNAGMNEISPPVRNTYAGAPPSRPDIVGMADAEMAVDGDFKGARTTKYIMEESHSKHAEMLARTNPLIAAAILREINDGVQKFHDGIYGGELFLCEKKLAEDIDQELNREKEGSFFNYRDKFLNFSVVIGNMGYCGDIPCFRYKVMYPEKWTHVYDTAYISVFFTLKEVELRRLLSGASA